MNDKKILILVSCNNKEFYGKRAEIVENTWAKDIIDSSYDNITFYLYTAMDEEMRDHTLNRKYGIIDSSCNSIFVPEGDEMLDSYDKMMSVLRTLHRNIDDYDYLFKTTSDTYVNVELLNEFVGNLADDDEKIYCGTLLSTKYWCAPYEYCLYPKSDGILIPLKVYKDIISLPKYKALVKKNDTVNSTEQIKVYKKRIDETAIGCLIDTYLIDKNENHTKYYVDWNAKFFKDLKPEEYSSQLTIMMSKTPEDDVVSEMKTVNEKVRNDSSNGSISLEYINSYINDENSPVITKINEDNTVEKMKYANFVKFSDTYKKLPKNQIDSSIVIDHFYTLVPSTTFFDYYNIPHNHKICLIENYEKEKYICSCEFDCKHCRYFIDSSLFKG